MLSSILGGGGKWCEGWRKVSCFVCYSVGGSMGENWGTICIRCAVHCVGCIRGRLVKVLGGWRGPSLKVSLNMDEMWNYGAAK